jgi:hypothetical protein
LLIVAAPEVADETTTPPKTSSFLLIVFMNIFNAIYCNEDPYHPQNRSTSDILGQTRLSNLNKLHHFSDPPQCTSWPNLPVTKNDKSQRPIENLEIQIEINVEFSANLRLIIPEPSNQSGSQKILLDHSHQKTTGEIVELLAPGKPGGAPAKSSTLPRPPAGPSEAGPLRQAS